MKNIYDRFEAVKDDYLKFGRIENKRHGRPDMHAFLLLDELHSNPGWDIVAAAEHDEIWLDFPESQVELLTDEHILELVRCGVRLDSDGGLAMFA